MMVNDKEHLYNNVPDYRYYPNGFQETMHRFDYPPVCPCQYEAGWQYMMNPPYINHVPENDVRSNGIDAHHVMQQFLTTDGQVDIQKMLQTIGQFANTVQQVSPVIKQINDIIKSFRT